MTSGTDGLQGSAAALLEVGVVSPLHRFRWSQIYRIMNAREWMLEELKKRNASSWDWEADLRFAEFLGDNYAVEAIKAMMEAQLFPAQLSVFNSVIRPRITRKRLKILRELVRQGRVEAWWGGTGESGKTSFGVNRIRTYGLVRKSIER